MGSNGDSEAVHPVEEATVPGDTSAADDRQCKESDVRRVADSSVVSCRDFTAAAEHSSPVEGN